MRWSAYAHDMAVPTLQVYLNRGSYPVAQAALEGAEGTQLHYLPYYETVAAGDYRVTALPARHYDGDGAAIYVVEGDKTLLYAHDTGYLFDEVFAYIAEKGLRFDLITLDCNYVELPVDDEGGHMGLPNIRRVVARLQEMGAVDDRTVKVVNHFSHNG